MLPASGGGAAYSGAAQSAVYGAMYDAAYPEAAEVTEDASEEEIQAAEPTYSTAASEPASGAADRFAAMGLEEAAPEAPGVPLPEAPGAGTGGTAFPSGAAQRSVDNGDAGTPGSSDLDGTAPPSASRSAAGTSNDTGGLTAGYSVTSAPLPEETAQKAAPKAPGTADSTGAAAPAASAYNAPAEAAETEGLLSASASGGTNANRFSFPGAARTESTGVAEDTADAMNGQADALVRVLPAEAAPLLVKWTPTEETDGGAWYVLTAAEYGEVYAALQVQDLASTIEPPEGANAVRVFLERAEDNGEVSS